MTDRAVHGRKPNGSGYIKVVRHADGAARYEARYGKQHLGTFESRKLAEAAITAAAAAAADGGAADAAWHELRAWVWERYAITAHTTETPTIGASLTLTVYVLTYELARWSAGRVQMQTVELGRFHTLDVAQRAARKHAIAVKRGIDPANDNGQLEVRDA